MTSGEGTDMPTSGGFFAIFLHLVGPVTAGAGRSTARLRRGEVDGLATVMCEFERPRALRERGVVGRRSAREAGCTTLAYLPLMAERSTLNCRGHRCHDPGRPRSRGNPAFSWSAFCWHSSASAPVLV
jgi:hypothetical protein